MRKFKRILFMLAVILAAILLPSARVMAEEQEKEFHTIDEDDEFIVCIEWENTRPIVKFVSPSGEIFDTAQEREGTQISVGDKMLFYYIEEAEAGRWKVIYDKLDNENIYISLQNVTAPFIVKDVKVDEVDGTYANVHFFVEYETDKGVDYKVYISANEDSRGQEIKSGYCNTNEEIEVRVNLEKFSSYDHYKIYVYASFVKDGVEIFDGAYSDAFKYVNPNQTDLTSPTTLEIKPNNLSARIFWEPQYAYTYLVSFFEEGKGEPSVFEEISDTSINSYEFSIGTETKKFEIHIAEKYRYGTYSNEKVYYFDMTDIPEVEFEEALATGKGYVSLHYKNFTDNKKTEISLNGDKREVILYVEKEGDLQVEVNQDFNIVEVIYHYDDEISLVYDKEIYFNNIPPRIYMLTDYSDVVTGKNQIELMGSATEAEKILVNGTEIEIAEDGTFSYLAKLKEGENIFTIEAFDILENGSMYVAKITYNPALAAEEDNIGDSDTDVDADATVSDENNENEKEPSAVMQLVKDFLPAIIALVLGLILIIVVAVIPKKKEKTGAVAAINKVLIYLLILGAIAEGFCLYKWLGLKKSNNSVGFIETAYNSVEEAGNLLNAEIMWKNFTFYGIIGLATVAVVLGVTILISTLAKKHKANKQSQKESN